MEASLNTMNAPISAGLAPVGITTDQLPQFGNIVAYCSPYRLARTEATTLQLPSPKVTCPRLTAGFRSTRQHFDPPATAGQVDLLGTKRQRFRYSGSMAFRTNGPAVLPARALSALETERKKYLFRPKGPAVRGLRAEETNCRPFGPQIHNCVTYPRPVVPGWLNDWPPWAGNPRPQYYEQNCNHCRKTWSSSPSGAQFDRPGRTN